MVEEAVVQRRRQKEVMSEETAAVKVGDSFAALQEDLYEVFRDLSCDIKHETQRTYDVMECMCKKFWVRQWAPVEMWAGGRKYVVDDGKRTVDA